MANVTNELIFETLKTIQSKLAEHDRRFDTIDERFKRMTREMRAFRLIGRGLIGHDVVQGDKIDNRRERVERIEKRLEVTD